MVVRRLTHGDEKMLEAFLERTANTSMHIRSNVRREGFAWAGKRHQGIYYGAFEEDGSLSGMLGYFWNGNILMQPGDHLPALLDALRCENVPVRGLLGPASDVREALHLLKLTDWPMQMSRDEKVYVLDLDEMALPDNLASGRVRVRNLAKEDFDLAVCWRIASNMESLGAKDTPEMRAEVEKEIAAKTQSGEISIAEADGRPVAMSGRDATLPDSVTVGPVWTPPEERCNGYARAVVAGSLLHAREKLGGKKSILFTDNPAAVKAYEAIGFRRVDEYGLTILAKDFTLGPLPK